MKLVKVIFVIGLVAALGVIGFIYSGVYPVAADLPHHPVTYQLLQVLRERSIARASRSIQVPALDAPDLLLLGGPDYHEMCAGCHLRPGRAESDLSIGLYPAPPNLADPDYHAGPADSRDQARRRFWIIKHGIKASGMPAWGKTHSDQRIWAMVAFLRRLPELTPEQYQILTARGESGAGGHSG